jgi:hypothetical protein
MTNLDALKVTFLMTVELTFAAIKLGEAHLDKRDFEAMCRRIDNSMILYNSVNDSFFSEKQVAACELARG